GELVDEAFEALDTLGQDPEEALHDGAPRFRVHLLGELHRALHVGEQNGDLLAFALERGLRLQDLLGEVLGRVGARVGCRGGGGRQRGPALTAELRGWPVAGAAGRARDFQWCAALLTEDRIGEVLGLALGAFHRAMTVFRLLARPFAARNSLSNTVSAVWDV